MTVVAETGSTEKGEPVEVDERRTFHAFHEVAQRELAKIAPRLGDRVGVRFDGKVPGKNYFAYRITSDSEPAFNWKEFGQGGDEELESEPDGVQSPLVGLSKAMGDDDADGPPF